MSVTITQQPYLFSLNRQDLIFVATSTEFAQPGFRYKIHIEIVPGDGSGTFSTYFYLSPNAADDLVFNARELLSQYKLSLLNGTVHSNNLFLSDDDSSLNLISEFGVAEAWLVDGVLTENPGSEVTIADQIYCRVGFYDPKFGFKPDPESTNTEIAFTLNHSTKRACSDRKYNTHKWSWGDTFGVSSGTNRTFIPVREADWGVLSYCGGTTALSNNLVATIRLRLYDATNTVHEYTEADYGLTVNYIGCYPANLNANGTITVKPEDYPGWIYYTIEFLTAGNVVCGMTYVFYNTELWGQTDCKHDVVRLAWANSRAGWDYQNFIKLNEQSVQMDRKRYQKVVGNYGTAGTFTYGAYESGLNEINVISTQYLTVNTDWLQEGEFEFLRSLLVSRQVHWVHDDGSFLPVLIEDSDYVMKRERNGKLQKLTLKLRLANQFTT